MPVDLAAFSARIRRFQEQTLPRAVERKVDSLGEELLARVKANTPVDTGDAKDGWELHKEGRGYGRTVRLTNDVPYVEQLEQGSSSQAPNGIVEVSIEELKAANK